MNHSFIFALCPTYTQKNKKIVKIRLQDYHYFMAGCNKAVTGKGKVSVVHVRWTSACCSSQASALCKLSINPEIPRINVMSTRLHR